VEGKNAAANGEHFAADADSLGEVTGDVRKRGEEEITEIVANEARGRAWKAILEQAAEKGFIF